MIISTPEEHEAALAELMTIIDKYPSDEWIKVPDDVGQRIDELSEAIVLYEEIHFPMEKP